jgi:hypothetical protein
MADLTEPNYYQRDSRHQSQKAVDGHEKMRWKPSIIWPWRRRARIELPPDPATKQKC